MLNHRLFLFVSVLFSLVLMSCASAQFSYDYPATRTEVTGEWVIASRNVQDERTDKAIDAIFERNPFDEINHIIKEEIMSTGLFKDIVMIPDGHWSDPEYLQRHRVDVVLDVSIKKLMWEVPDYDRKLGTMTVVSVLTGGLGGLIYGSTSTDVYGHALMNAKLVDAETGKMLLDKDYSGSHKDTMAKLSCDTPETKSKMIGTSLKICMDELKIDLQSTVASIATERRQMAIRENALPDEVAH